MPTTVHVPKRVSTELIRQRLGDARAEKLLLEVFGPMLMPPPHLSLEAVQRTKDVLEGKVNGHTAAHALPLVLRAYFIERKVARTAFLDWLTSKLLVAEGRDGELNAAEMGEVRKAAKARLNAPRKRGRPKGSRNRKVAR